MRKFLKYVLAIAVFVTASAAVLDGLYTYIYAHSKPRNKFQYLMQIKPRHYDNIFLGSSRTANHINSETFTRLTGQSAINLGIDGAILEDSFLELKLLLSKNVTVSRVYLQVDYLFEKEGVSFVANSSALPFLRTPVVREHLRPMLPDFERSLYLPFYRYATADFATGFRQVTLSAAGKKAKVDFNNGYSPKEGMGKFTPFWLPKTIRERNTAIDKFRKICAEHNIELVFFIAPVCSETGNLDYVSKLKTKIPELKDYSRIFPDSEFFNCNHLLPQGAEAFTKILAQDRITSPPRP
ncbi:hypothetical protein [Flavobacterium selenitireducens]|uniref:hypothetical protein n=1 Tax=Flavobacterium selenitireducens TaxID=2722704 RepID=UPI00168A937A|nr:hypothetical protein [Flavobacterium selenitireducens]MBD3583953.1 hypothetical protein [Flavobacterium selenitireducens]